MSVDSISGVTNLPLLRLVGALFGVGFSIAGALGVRVAVQSRGWASAPAIVVQSQRIGAGNHQSAVVVAQFRAGAYEYGCSHVRLGRDNAPTDAADFPVGSHALVHYDPSNLARCTLVPGVSGASLAFLAVGLAALAVAFYADKRIKAARKSCPAAAG